MMKVLLALIVVFTTSSIVVVESVKQCRYKCDDEYKPVCGHDEHLKYQTFCNLAAMETCNNVKGSSFTKIADGPCYPSSRGWKAQQPQPAHDQTTMMPTTTELDSRN